MSSYLKKALVLFILCGTFHPLSSQPYGYYQYSSDTEAPFDETSTVIKDNEGFIWVGTQNGLYRFDGIHFELYSLNTESQFINQLQRSEDGLLFLNEKGLYKIEDPASEPDIRALIEGAIVQDPEGLFYPNDFIIDKDQEIWISQSNHSIGRLNGSEFQNYPFSKSKEVQHVAICADDNGSIWILSPLDGLFYFNKSINTFEKRLDIKNGHSLLVVEDNILIGGNDLSVYVLKDDDLKLNRKISIGEDPISTINEGQNGRYILGTQKGKLLELNNLESQPQIIYGANEAHRVEELDFGKINDVYIIADDDGTDNIKLWVCSETGLWLLQQRFFETVQNLPMNNPISIAIGKQGKAWVPMNYLYEITPNHNGFSAEQIHSDLTVNAVVQDVSGFLWVSTTSPRVELIKYDQNKEIRRYDFHQRGEAIFYLFSDSKGNTWFCQAPIDKPIIGIAMINTLGEIKYYDDSKGFSSRVLAIQESDRGEIYAVGIGERSYLYRYDEENDNFENLSPSLPFTPKLNFEAHDLTIDNRGVVWLATTDGLLRYDSETITLIKDDILGQEEVRGVTHYSNNTIWISTATKGLVFHQENISTALGEQEGMPSVISSYRCITTDVDGRLWAGTPEGLVYSRISAATLPYSNSPRLRKITVEKEDIISDFDADLHFKKDSPIQLEFTNLSFPSRNVQYQYRMLPADNRQIMLEEHPWTSNESNNTLILEGIGKGEYFLELRARQPGGYQWSNPMEFQFSVFIPWYSTPGIIYGSLGLVILITIYYLRFYIKKRFVRLHQVVNYANEKLEQKEAQLLQKDQEFEVQQAALANASSNIETLELFIKGIPKDASWDDIITAMGKAVIRADDINAFEIAFMENNEIVHRGYSDQERSGYTFRSKPFDVKVSLTCWAMSNNKEVLIKDFEKEHPEYIDKKEAYRFESLLFIPFTLENKQPVALCAYSTKKDDFDENDLVMFRILAQFIQNSVQHELKKQ